jgi:hypothetical protein
MKIKLPDNFGVPGIKPHEKIDSDDYHSLFEWEENE